MLQKVMGTRWDDVKKALQGVRSVEGTKKEISKNPNIVNTSEYNADD